MANDNNKVAGQKASNATHSQTTDKSIAAAMQAGTMQNALETGTLKGVGVGNGGDSKKRLIPGIEGVVTGGDSGTLGKNIFKEMGVSPNSPRTGYQAQHIIPAELMDHPVLQKIGMDLDDASNGIFLRVRKTGACSAKSRHQGSHPQYTNVLEERLDAMDINKSVDELQREVYELQQAARRMMNAGTPIYPKDHVPKSKSAKSRKGKISKKSKKIYKIDGSTRTEDFIRRKLLQYGIQS